MEVKLTREEVDLIINLLLEKNSEIEEEEINMFIDNTYVMNRRHTNTYDILIKKIIAQHNQFEIVICANSKKVEENIDAEYRRLIYDFRCHPSRVHVDKRGKKVTLTADDSCVLDKTTMFVSISSKTTDGLKADTVTIDYSGFPKYDTELIEKAILLKKKIDCGNLWK